MRRRHRLPRRPSVPRRAVHRPRRRRAAAAHRRAIARQSARRAVVLRADGAGTRVGSRELRDRRPRLDRRRSLARPPQRHPVDVGAARARLYDRRALDALDGSPVESIACLANGPCPTTRAGGNALLTGVVFGTGYAPTGPTGVCGIGTDPRAVACGTHEAPEVCGSTSDRLGAPRTAPYDAGAIVCP